MDDAIETELRGARVSWVKEDMDAWRAFSGALVQAQNIPGHPMQGLPKDVRRRLLVVAYENTNLRRAERWLEKKGAEETVLRCIAEPSSRHAPGSACALLLCPKLLRRGLDAIGKSDKSSRGHCWICSRVGLSFSCNPPHPDWHFSDIACMCYECFTAFFELSEHDRVIASTDCISELSPTYIKLRDPELPVPVFYETTYWSHTREKKVAVLYSYRDARKLERKKKARQLARLAAAFPDLPYFRKIQCDEFPKDEPVPANCALPLGYSADEWREGSLRQQLHSKQCLLFRLACVDMKRFNKGNGYNYDVYDDAVDKMWAAYEAAVGARAEWLARYPCPLDSWPAMGPRAAELYWRARLAYRRARAAVGFERLCLSVITLGVLFLHLRL